MNKNPTILLIEDERPLIEAIKSKLDLNGLDSVSARTVNQAIDYMESIEHIDLIWLDHYLLGKEDGLDFVIKIKKEDKWKNIPIFVISNTATADKKFSYINLGIEKYYIKSDHRLDEIVEDIKNFLSKNNG